jgi:hypothetical protein
MAKTPRYRPITRHLCSCGQTGHKAKVTSFPKRCTEPDGSLILEAQPLASSITFPVINYGSGVDNKVERCQVICV